MKNKNMKASVVLALILSNLISISVMAQIVTLHESVGDTISLIEKRKYDLFPQISAQNFDYAILHKTSDAYRLACNSNLNETFVNVSSTEIAQLRERIEVLDAFFASSKNEDSNNLTESVILHKNYYLDYENLVNKEEMKVIKNQGKLENVMQMINAPDHIKYQNEDYTRNRLNSPYLNTGAQ